MGRKAKIERLEVTMDELGAIVERAQLCDDDRAKLTAALETLALLTNELEMKGASIRRLRKLLFGSGSEKLDAVLREIASSAAGGEGDPAPGEAGSRGGDVGDGASSSPPKRKAKGHGRNGASAYRGASKVKVPHASLSPGKPCPSCEKGKVYGSVPPRLIVRVRGQAPLCATVYALKRLRCNLCGEVFTARPPPEVGEAKYDATAAAMIALLKYGSGLPFHRLEGLQKGLGIPLPSATQWEIVRDSAEQIEPVYRELVRQAAQGEVVHNDDTPMKILERMGERWAKSVARGAQKASDRKAVSTTGIVSRVAGHDVALFFTGPETAGKNLEKVLAERKAELDAPIQMSDALSHNAADGVDTIVAYCLAHGRRRFVDVAKSFPAECRHVLEVLRDLYQIDAEAREQGLSPAERLALHQEKSAPKMEALEAWMQEKLEKREVEPNSGLGEAIAYMQKHWAPLTLFLRAPGAPLDNNVCERALKKVILHRKNAMFFKSDEGARVGDLYLSLIYTAQLCAANPFEYLVSLQRNAEAAVASPGDWMPWNYAPSHGRLEPPDPQPAAPSH
jgi:transposase